MGDGTEACATLLGAGDKRQLMEARRTLTETEEMAVSNETGKCMEELRWNVMGGNVTEAGEGYTNCVTIAGAKILETDDYGNDDDGSSSSSSATGGFVFAMTAAFFLALISIAYNKQMIVEGRKEKCKIVKSGENFSHFICKLI